MRKTSRFALTAAATLWGGIVAAQVTPSDVRDLVGARAAGAESELASRGYVGAGGGTGDDRKWTYWWNATRGVCLSVTTVDGRYDSIVATPVDDCRQDLRQAYASDQERRGSDERSYDHISLVCYGEQEKLESRPRSGYEWDRDNRKVVPRSGYELTTKTYDTAVVVRIDGDRGWIRLAKDMVPVLHSDSANGWYDIAKLSVSPDTIRGEFRLNGLNRPKLTIDRTTGRITLEGLTDFRGSCEAMGTDRKF